MLFRAPACCADWRALPICPASAATPARSQNTHTLAHTRSHAKNKTRSWARLFEARVPGVKITTTHAYEIFQPHRWRCANAACGKVYGRHSKTIDEARHRCALCRSRLVYLGRFARDGRPALATTPAPIKGAAGGGGAGAGAAAAALAGLPLPSPLGGRAPAAMAAWAAASAGAAPAATPRGGNAYSAFVKERFATTKAALPRGTPHKELMLRIAAEWREEKAARAAAAAAASAAASAGEGAAGPGGGAAATAEAAAAAAPVPAEAIDLTQEEEGESSGGAPAGGSGKGAAVEGGCGGGKAEDGEEEEDEDEDGMASLIRRLNL